MRRFLNLLVVVAGVGILVTTCCRKEASGNTVEIGVITSLTGNQAAFGQPKHSRSTLRRAGHLARGQRRASQWRCSKLWPSGSGRAPGGGYCPPNGVSERSIEMLNHNCGLAGQSARLARADWPAWWCNNSGG